VRRYSRKHVTDTALLHQLAAHVATERATTAELLADLGEVDARRLYAPAGYPSMFAYCVGELRLSEDGASKRIHAARAARRFPAVLPRLADGRLHLTAVLLLAPHLAPENAETLLEAATHRSCRQIEELIAQLFPKPDLPALVTAPAAEHAARHVEQGETEHAARHVGGGDVGLWPAHGTPAPSRIKPLSANGYGLQCTLPTATYQKLRRIQELLGHDAPSTALAEVLDGAFDAYLARLERRNLAATERPRAARGSTNPRHVPAAVRRAVRARDGGQCTFVSVTGHRCEARTHLELDHVEPVARGGPATVANLRLRCRAHNQLAADEVFGGAFMDGRRHRSSEPARPAARPIGEAAERAVAERAVRDEVERRAGAERAVAEAHARAAEAAQAASEEVRRRATAAEEVVPYLRRLGIRAEAARAVAAGCQADPCAPIEDRIRQALAFYGRLRFPGAKPRTAA
jgi:5-methylcytosine-specific restriction endonuclease McrA